MKPPPIEILPSGLPKYLPRFAESFRIYIDGMYDQRLITSEWLWNHVFSRHVEDYCKQLAKAGAIGIIACTLDKGAHTREGMIDYYGRPDHPSVHWHWKPGAKEWLVSDKALDDYSDAYGYPRGLIRWPVDGGGDVPTELRARHGETQAASQRRHELVLAYRRKLKA